MKAILEFDLDETHDIYAHKRAVSATDAYLALYTIQERLFKARKHEELNGIRMSRGNLKLLHEVLTTIDDVMVGYNINLDDLE